MVITITGCQHLDFDTSDGKHIQGRKFHYVYKSDRPNDEGLLTDTLFIGTGSPVKLPTEMPFNSEYELVYDFNGRRAYLTEIRLVE